MDHNLVNTIVLTKQLYCFSRYCVGQLMANSSFVGEVLALCRSSCGSYEQKQFKLITEKSLEHLEILKTHASTYMYSFREKSPFIFSGNV